MCGIIGIISSGNVNQEIYDGLITLQHRGQDSAGMVTYDGHFNLKKGNGLVRDVFHTKNMLRLLGNIGIGHVRYPTAGSYRVEESQPFYVNSPYGIALVHNGNLTNYESLKKEVLENEKRFLNTRSDSEVLLNVLAHELRTLGVKQMAPKDIFKAMHHVFKRVKGSYSIISLIAGHGLLAFRDPYGIRPLIVGKKTSTKSTDYIIASESVALDTLGYEVVSDVQPGEVVYIDMNHNLHRKICVDKPTWAPCLFEWVYIARPDSTIDNINVYKTRLRLGEYLVDKIKKANIAIDVVMPVPDSGRSAAIPLAAKLGVPYREGLVKNRYIGRTFIMPGQDLRQKSVRFKLNPIKLELKGKKVLLVEDSIVRGTTSKKIIEMVRAAGAKKVYIASCAPALISPCVYGVDMPTRKDFIAYKLSNDVIAKVIGADKVFYQDLKDLVKAAQKGNPKITGFCGACFSGKYPTPEVTEVTLREAEESRRQAYPEEVQDSDEALTLL
ncbi:amidophosphoribosyltransferase [Candidatus Peregrinibacteria bacterium]|nr:amidophosphoribosyltransferase [Candidatus Peregrinibacteria bacterium]